MPIWRATRSGIGGTRNITTRKRTSSGRRRTSRSLGSGDDFRWYNPKTGGYLTGARARKAAEAESSRVAGEAKQKQEASKQAALGYYAPIQDALAGMSPELITSEQQAGMMGTRRAELGAYGQNLASMYTDPYSGVQGGQRRQIGMGIAGMQANLPIGLELEVGEANRQAALGLHSAQAGVAGGMAGVQMAYQYDPGLEYLKQLGFGAGYSSRKLGASAS